MMHKHKPKDGQRKFSPPGPTYMSNDQIASYLNDLRTNRPARPNGSRPLPTRPGMSSSTLHDGLPPRASSALSHYRTSGLEKASEEEHPRAASALSHRRNTSHVSVGSSAGRPLVQEPMSFTVRKYMSPTKMAVRTIPLSPSASYRESGQRQKEKEEARSLRDALEEMDLQDEQRLHQAAQDEATELVWMHQHPGVPYKNPLSPYRNPDLNKTSDEPDTSNHSELQSSGTRAYTRRKSRRSASESSAGSHHTAEIAESGAEDGSGTKNGTVRKKNRVNFALPPDEHSSELIHGHRGSRPRNVSNDSSRGIFRNPNDQIYEEPEEQDSKIQERPSPVRADSAALKAKPRNAQPQGSRPFPGRFSSRSFADKLSRFEIHRNPPSQSRNPAYRTNDPLPQSAPETEQGANTIPTKDGIEVRSDEIRAATSKRLKDRSSNLPMPSAVSDRPGRPIVSFDRSWKPTEAQSRSHRDSLVRQASASPSPPPEPAVPSIQVSEAPPIPVINLPADKEPTISEMAASSQTDEKSVRPLPDPKKSINLRNSPPKQPTPASQNRWYSKYTRAGVPTATCAACNLPIAGKIVTAAGSRFHPECFTCHHCHTALECVAFYQEPEAKRAERLANGPSDDEEAHALRFFCHLDFHEIFSPRCKSCKTPIEGEVVVACGAEWHVGHFFCAECGDPFDSTTPFVEKEGFAWCLRCHSRRSAPRCLGCKQPVLDEVVITAIGGQWHDKCFVCHECGSGFGPEGRFFVREGEPKRTAKGRIIGGPVQLAICEKCEGIRLKASP